MMSNDVVFILGSLIGLLIGSITGAFIISALCVSKNSELQDRIDKAIEYIEEHKRNVYDTFGEGIVFGEIDGIKEILSILKGDSNE